MKKRMTALLLAVVILCGLLYLPAAATPGETVPEIDTTGVLTKLAAYDQVFTAMGSTSKDSMPIGNGSMAANVWVESNGDLVCYLSRCDSYSEAGRLLKIGRIRIGATYADDGTNVFAAGTAFQQKLVLAEGAVYVTAGAGERQVTFKLWIDGENDVMEVEMDAAADVKLTVKNDLWRTETLTMDTSGGNNRSFIGVHINYGDDLPSESADVVVDRTEENQLMWYHRNDYSRYETMVEYQQLNAAGKIEDYFEKYPDPYLYNTFGALVEGEGFTASDTKTLTTQNAGKSFNLRVFTHCDQTTSAADWQNAIANKKNKANDDNLADRWAAHKAWWEDVWTRSWIFITGDAQAQNVTRGYILQRYQVACMGASEDTIHFNGGLFTMCTNEAQGDDYRDWGSMYWHQNTRLVYWPMLAAGDYEFLTAYFDLYLNALPLRKEIAKEFFDVEGAYYPEQMYEYGADGTRDKLQWALDGTGDYTTYHWQNGFEVLMMMLDAYDMTGDETYVTKYIVPIGQELIRFYYGMYYDEDTGLLNITPSNALEEYWNCTNPTDHIAGLTAILPRMLALTNEAATDALKAEWRQCYEALPAVKESADGSRYLPAYSYGGTKNSENPELYTVFPYELSTIDSDEATLQKGVNTFNARLFKMNGCWHQDGVQAAMLGLTDAAKSNVAYGLTAKDGGCRFAGYWVKGNDEVPDFDNGGQASLALQRMLLQSYDERIYVLPAWPSNWDVDFCLDANYQTKVHLTYEDGEITGLELQSEDSGRAEDVVLPAKTVEQSVEFETAAYEVEGSVSVQPAVAADGSASGGQILTFKPTEAGASISFTVEVEEAAEYSLTVRLKRWSDYGTYQFSVNGENVGYPIDGSSGSGYGSYALGKAALRKGENTVTLTVTGKGSTGSGYNAALDSLSLMARITDAESPEEPEPAEVAYVDNTDSRIQYTGTWKDPYAAAGYYGGNQVSSNSYDATASLTFTGTGIGYITEISTSCGLVGVYIDGTLVEQVDTYTSAAIGTKQLELFQKTDLPYGEHTIEIKLAGPSGSSNPHVKLDAFKIYNAPQQPEEPEPTDCAVEITDVSCSGSTVTVTGTSEHLDGRKVEVILDENLDLRYVAQTLRDNGDWQCVFDLPYDGVYALEASIRDYDDFEATMQTVPDDNFFEVDGRVVWGAAVTEGPDGLYYMIFSTWHKTQGFGNDWAVYSELGYATSTSPDGPFVYQGIALDAAYSNCTNETPVDWDGVGELQVFHNPTLMHSERDGKYYLYFMGTNATEGNYTYAYGRNHQRIGVAVADTPAGPWTVYDEPVIDVREGLFDELLVSNPSVTELKNDDGTYTYYTVYKGVRSPTGTPLDGKDIVVSGCGTSDSPFGPFDRSEAPIMQNPTQNFSVEDCYVWSRDGVLYALAKDAHSYFTGVTGYSYSYALFVSEDGENWAVSEDYPLAFVTEVDWEKGAQKVSNLERAQLYLEEEIPFLLCCATTKNGQSPYSGHAPINVQIPLLGVPLARDTATLEISGQGQSKTPDKSGLEALLTRADQADSALFEAEDWSKLVSARTAARRILEDTTVLQADVDFYTAQLEEKLAAQLDPGEIPTNLALHKPAEGTNTYTTNAQGVPVSGYEPDKAVDGDTSTRWATKLTGVESTLTVDLETVCRIDSFQIDQYIGGSDGVASRIRSYALEVYDGAAWTTVASGTATAAQFTVTLEQPVYGRQVRLVLGDDAPLAPTIKEFAVNGIVHTHSGTEVPGKAPTCTEAGVKTYYACGCGKRFEEEACTAEITDLETWKVLPALGHSADAAWEKNETQHYHACTRCGETLDAAAHTGVLEGYVAPTRWETGYSGDTVCEVCGYLMEQGHALPKLPGGGTHVRPEAPESKPETKPETPVFMDVRSTDWYAEAVEYVAENGIMTGVAEGVFDPEGAVTRAMVWTVLARLDGETTEGGGSWYSKAQAWAIDTGVSDGTDPMGSITREQLAAMLYRSAGSPAVTGSLSAYPDAAAVSDWAVDAMIWATETGLINGINGNLSPKTGATRAQLATLLMRQLER